MKTLKQYAGVVLAGVALLVSTAPASAQSFPGKLVRITSPFSAALTPDVVIRVVADKLARSWGQQVMIDARPGANGFIAIGALMKAGGDAAETPQAK